MGEDHKAGIRRALERFEARNAPRAKKKGKRLDVPYESQEARWFVQWLEARGLLFCHIPNEGQALQRGGLAGTRAAPWCPRPADLHLPSRDQGDRDRA